MRHIPLIYSFGILKKNAAKNRRPIFPGNYFITKITNKKLIHFYQYIYNYTQVVLNEKQKYISENTTFLFISAQLHIVSTF